MPSGVAPSYSRATETISCRFSTRVTSCRSSELSSDAWYPVLSSTASTSSATGPPVAACSRRSSTSALNPAMADADLAARAGTSDGVRSACANVIRSRAA